MLVVSSCAQLSQCVLRWRNPSKHCHANHLPPAGYVLDPEYHKHDVLGNMEVQQGFMRTAKKLFPDVDLAILTADLTKFR